MDPGYRKIASLDADLEHILIWEDITLVPQDVATPLAQVFKSFLSLNMHIPIMHSRTKKIITELGWRPPSFIVRAHFIDYLISIKTQL